MNKLLSSIEEAMVFPYSGTLVDDEHLLSENVRKKFAGNYVMYYLPDKEERIVYVLRILYGKRSIEELVNDLGI